MNENLQATANEYRHALVKMECLHSDKLRIESEISSQTKVIDAFRAILQKSVGRNKPLTAIRLDDDMVLVVSYNPQWDNHSYEILELK